MKFLHFLKFRVEIILYINFFKDWKMITSEIRLKVIDIWLEIFSGGTYKPLIVIEQITYLLFIKKLNEINIRRGRR